jgi:hypothetical protein
MSTLDQSLDDIISTKPRNRGIRKGRRGLRTIKPATTRPARPVQQPQAARTHPASQGVQTNNANSVFDQGSKMIVSNLV